MNDFNWVAYSPVGDIPMVRGTEHAVTRYVRRNPEFFVKDPAGNKYTYDKEKAELVPVNPNG